MKIAPRKKIIFVTGTDTGVGKTVFTALLLMHHQTQGLTALAMKPFSSGNRADAELLHSLQSSECTLDEVNPFHFSKPLAPLVAARLERKHVKLRDAIRAIKAIEQRADRLIIEGCGGLMVPLGSGYSVAELIRELNCDEVVVVAVNRLGVINHTLLTIKALQDVGVEKIFVVLVQARNPDESSKTNGTALAKLVKHPVVRIPFFTENLSKTDGLKKSFKKIKKTLAQNFV